MSDIKVFIIAALTADGFIGKTADHLADWTAKEDKQLYTKLTKEAGAAVFGSKTYDTFGRPLKDRRMIIYTRHPEKYSDPALETTQEAPAELIQRLQKEGVKRVAISGGSQIYDAFLRAGVVDELYLTVEPILFGQGITLFSGSFEQKLELLSLEKLNQHTFYTHYKVVKPPEGPQSS